MKEIKIINREIEDNEYSQPEVKSKALRILIILFFLFIILLLILSLAYFALYKAKNKSIFEDKQIIKYQDILPKKNLDKNKIVSSLDEIFNSRQLYINDADLTTKYIRYIRPIDEKEEEKYKKKNFESELKFTEDYFKKREDQYKYNNYVKLCQQEKLLDKNKIEYNHKPLISIILCSYDKKDILIKSVRSIQNQSLKNIEIIIVDDYSLDKSDVKYKYLLNTDPRIRVFKHTKNLGLWRSRIDGFLYSNAKYIIFFDPSDFYEDNYVLEDFYNLMIKHDLDSAKMNFRIIGNYSNVNNSKIPYHVGENSKIVYETVNIEKMDTMVFGSKGNNIWNRMIRANVFTKGLCLLNEKVLNIYQNMIDDYYFNIIVNKKSNNYLIVDRIGYVYYYDGQGEGTAKIKTEAQRDKAIQQYISILYYEYYFLPKDNNKEKIISKLKEYNDKTSKFKLNFLRTRFYLLNDLLNILIEDPFVSKNNKIFLNKLLNESKALEKEIQSQKINKL